MKQSRFTSILDAIGGTALGFVVALAIQFTISAVYALPLRPFDNVGIVLVFTVASLVRGYVWRRFMELFHVRHKLSPFTQAVVVERREQESREGYDAEHDNDHEPGDLALAGAAYAICARSHVVEHRSSSGIFDIQNRVWPFREPMKLYDFRRDLVRSAALIIAEGDRHDRMRRRKVAAVKVEAA